MFTEIENRRHPDGDIQNYILNLAECKQTCMDMPHFCSGLDYINDVCYLHYNDVYNRNNLVDKQGHTHYSVTPC